MRYTDPLHPRPGGGGGHGDREAILTEFLKFQATGEMTMLDRLPKIIDDRRPHDRESDWHALEVKWGWTLDTAKALADALREIEHEADRRGLRAGATLGMLTETARLIDHTLRSIDIEDEHRRTDESLIPAAPTDDDGDDAVH